MDVRLRELVKQRAAGRCEYCGLRQEQEPLAFHIEHITARQHEGKDTEENLALRTLQISQLAAEILPHTGLRQ